jgi:hypothetical protein
VNILNPLPSIATWRRIPNIDSASQHSQLARYKPAYKSGTSVHELSESLDAVLSQSRLSPRTIIIVVVSTLSTQYLLHHMNCSVRAATTQHYIRLTNLLPRNNKSTTTFISSPLLLNKFGQQNLKLSRDVTLCDSANM